MLNGGFLIASAAGFWVMVQAGKESGGLKKLGQILGALIIICSLAGVGLKAYSLSTDCAPGGWGKGPCCMMGKGMGACPMTGGAPGQPLGR
ncbi:MAG: hypothetical protein JW937_09210 [Candidatus Omnitrophica bacterium]|nr:hypothetical protein [Candidatus Omnitrophota bacterium]